jgi:hypothetical protein
VSIDNDKALPWRRMALESAAIILSILLAFAIDASWDEFKERNREEAFLISLRSDFQEARSRIDQSASRHKNFVAMANELLQFHDVKGAYVDAESLAAKLGAVFFDWEVLYLPSGSRDALFASDDIEIISNEKLRAMLASWPSTLADAAEDDLWIADDVMNNMAPYLNGKIRVRNVARMTGSSAADYIPRIESVDYDVLWTDPMFDNLVSFRILNESYALNENKRLAEAVDEIIQIIEKELGR